MTRRNEALAVAGLFLLCILPCSLAEKDKNGEEIIPVDGGFPKAEARLYFQGDNFTVNLIPLLFVGLAIFAAVYLFDLLANGGDESGYGAPTGYGAPESSYGAPSYSAPAPEYAAPSYEAPHAGYNKRMLRTADYVARNIEAAQKKYQ